MARAPKKAPVAGSMSIRLDGLTLYACDSVAIDETGRFVDIVVDGVTSHRLASKTIFGTDAQGSWYACTTPRTESIAVNSVMFQAAGSVWGTGDDGLELYVPEAFADRVIIEGDVELSEQDAGEEEESEDGEDDGEAEEDEGEPEPEPTRRRRTTR
jgi:hypothetical protein